MTSEPPEKAALNITGIEQIARSQLAPFLSRSGKILYSAAATIRPGLVYFLGLNPGGDPERPEPSHYTLARALDELPSKSDNAFLDEIWQGAISPGVRPLQRRVQWICSTLGIATRDLCASNLIFLRSRTEKDAGYPAMADICWPVHQAIIGVVQPSLLLTHGNLVFDYILRRSVAPPQEAMTVRTFPSGHGDWRGRRARVAIGGHTMELIQLPHLSRYNPRRAQDLWDDLRTALSRPQREDTR